MIKNNYPKIGSVLYVFKKKKTYQKLIYNNSHVNIYFVSNVYNNGLKNPINVQYVELK